MKQPDLQELLDTANRLDELGASWQFSESAKLHLKNATFLIRLAVQREEDRRTNAQ